MRRPGWTLAVAASAILTIVGLRVVTLHAAGSLIISEFRLDGIDGENDEYVEIYNDSDAPHTVAPTSGSGYAIAASDGIVRCTIPTGTVIPARGHWLCTGSAYALGDYPASAETYAVGDGTISQNIPLNMAIALFNNNTGGGAFTLANRLDAAGSTGDGTPLYTEGTGYPSVAVSQKNHAWVRDECGKGGASNLFGACTRSTPKDTDNNAVDFFYIETDSPGGSGLRLGVPGPQNLTSPIVRNSGFSTVLLDATVSNSLPPNRVRDFTSDPGNHSTFGTLAIRRRFVNNTGVPVTRLRFRVIDLTTYPAASGVADLRARSSFTPTSVLGIQDSATCNATGTPAIPPCSVPLEILTHDQAISPNNPIYGGGYNGSLAINAIKLATPLAAGASVNVQFLLGIQQTGNFRFYVNIEALP